MLLLALARRRAYTVAGKHVLITGGSSGIGKALAREVLKRGASIVTLLARDKEKLRVAVSELEGEFPDRKVKSISADISKSSVKTVLEEECNSCPVDVLVNCAGVTTTALLEEIPHSKVEELVNINLLGSIYVTQALLPLFKKRNGGAIVFISSQAGQLGLYGYTVYCATKYALRGLAESLQMEVMPYKVSISISFPPDTETPQLVDERLLRSDIVNQLTSFGTVVLWNESIQPAFGIVLLKCSVPDCAV
ncbi:hypothetical protein EMCRGX_G031515 [Ephydatia muelleri]